MTEQRLKLGSAVDDVRMRVQRLVDVEPLAGYCVPNSASAINDRRHTSCFGLRVQVPADSGQLDSVRAGLVALAGTPKNCVGATRRSDGFGVTLGQSTSATGPTEAADCVGQFDGLAMVCEKTRPLRIVECDLTARACPTNLTNLTSCP
jgi:hypothetical protein